MKAKIKHIKFEDLHKLFRRELNLKEVNTYKQHLNTCEECSNMLKAIEAFETVELIQPQYNNKKYDNVFDRFSYGLKCLYAKNRIYLSKFKKKLAISKKLPPKQVTEFIFEKLYEKQITKKLIGQLLMGLRTPIFLLFPFIIIASIFGSLNNGKDVGQVDDTILFYKNRPCIAITDLPQSLDGEFRKFIQNVDDSREKGFFDKEIRDELVVEPQLAVINNSIHKANNRQIIIEELDYFFDDRKHIIYLFLTENADRQLVNNQLFNPSLGLLNIQSKSSRNTGISGLFNALSGLKGYRFFIICGFLSLVTLFIVIRKK